MDSSEMVSQLLFGEPVQILEMELPWVKVETLVDGYQGFSDIKHLHSLSEEQLKCWLNERSYLTELTCGISTPWGSQQLVRGAFIPFDRSSTFSIGNDKFTFENEPSKLTWKSTLEAAMSYLNSPYLWGGKSPFGIDCSGFTQTVLRFFDISIPRDASQQASCGREIIFDDKQAGDLAFFHNSSGKIIHVGFCGNNNDFIHASGRVRVDSITRYGIIHSESKELTHHLYSIRRM